METQNNTDGSANSLRGIIKDVRQKARNNSLMQRALVKLLNSKKEEITAFLGETKKQFFKNLFFITEIFVGNVAEFIVKDKFQQRAENKVGITLCMNNGFRTILESREDTKVSLTKNVILKKFSLTKPMNDTEIQAKFEKPNSIDIEIFLPLLWGMLSLQRKGEEKENGLLTNEHSNIFHIKLDNDIVIAVEVRLRGLCWHILAYELDYVNYWRNEDAFFDFIQ